MVISNKALFNLSLNKSGFAQYATTITVMYVLLSNFPSIISAMCTYTCCMQGIQIAHAYICLLVY